MQMTGVCIFLAYTDVEHMDRFNLCSVLSFFVKIRKMVVPDLLSSPPPAVAKKHNMCHAVSSICCVSPLPRYVSQLEMMVATLKISLERRNKRSGRTEKARIWDITDRTVRTWLSEAVETAAADGVTFSVPVTPHTLRHSYAMHMLYAGIPLKVLQSLMGHKSISSTEVYTKVFALDVAARHRVQFQMPGDEAVALLKKIGD